MKNNTYFKLGAIVVITLLLLIPTAMIKKLIHERELTQKAAIREVSSKWSEEQTISGPFISIPYFRYIREFSKKDSTTKINKFKEYIHILPTELNISGDINPEKRYRGIYEIVVYNSKIDFEGVFEKIDFSSYDIPLQDIQFDQTEFVIGINDLRGIEKQIAFKWNNDTVLFNPGFPSAKFHRPKFQWRLQQLFLLLHIIYRFPRPWSKYL